MIIAALTLLRTSVATLEENIRIYFKKIDDEVTNWTAVPQGLQQWRIIAVTLLIRKVSSPMALLNS
jgi:hypothetical protein